MKKTTLDIVYIAVCVALITVCTWICIPMTVPFTMQTFAIFLTIGLLGARRSIIAVSVYILLGAVGVPVFAGFTGSIAKIVSPTGGYIVGFLVMTVVTGIMTDKLPKKPYITFLSMLTGLVVLYAFGTAWYAVLFATSDAASWITILSTCVLPFIIPDILKILLAVLITSRVKSRI